MERKWGFGGFSGLTEDRTLNLEHSASHTTLCALSGASGAGARASIGGHGRTSTAEEFAEPEEATLFKGSNTPSFGVIRRKGSCSWLWDRWHTRIFCLDWGVIHGSSNFRTGRILRNRSCINSKNSTDTSDQVLSRDHFDSINDDGRLSITTEDIWLPQELTWIYIIDSQC